MGWSGRGRRFSRGGQRSEEKLLLETVRVMAERFRPELFEVFRWPFGEIVESSPLRVCERDP